MKVETSPTQLKLVALSLAVTVIGLLSLSVLLFFFELTSPKDQYVAKPKDTLKSKEGTITPSQLLNARGQYNKQMITVRGVIVPQAVVCEKRECPSQEPCCGCPLERNLVVKDYEASLTNTTYEQLKLLDRNLTPFCQRPLSSCEYDCGDWDKGSLYDIEGTFVYQSTPALKVALDMYLQVDNKQLVKKESTFDSFFNLFNQIRKLIEGFQTSGSYVINK